MQSKQPLWSLMTLGYRADDVSGRGLTFVNIAERHIDNG